MAIVNKSPKEVYELIQNNKDVVILDVRTEEEYKNDGHLKGAILINIQSGNFADKVNKLDKEKTYVVYCKGGIRSMKACNIMDGLGFKNIINLDGGIINWINNGLPVEK